MGDGESGLSRPPLDSCWTRQCVKGTRIVYVNRPYTIGIEGGDYIQEHSRGDVSQTTKHLVDTPLLSRAVYGPDDMLG